MAHEIELLTELSDCELEALAESKLAPTNQTRLDYLLARHAESVLSTPELEELDHLLSRVDHLNILKVRARYTINRKTTASAP